MLLQYVAAGCLAIEVQRKVSRLKVNSSLVMQQVIIHLIATCNLFLSFFFLNYKQVIALMGLNLFRLLFGFSALLTSSLVSAPPAALSTHQQVILHLKLYDKCFFMLCVSILGWQNSVISFAIFPSRLPLTSRSVHMWQRQAPYYLLRCVFWGQLTSASCPGEACVATVLLIIRPTAASLRYV